MLIFEVFVLVVSAPDIQNDGYATSTRYAIFLIARRFLTSKILIYLNPYQDTSTLLNVKRRFANCRSFVSTIFSILISENKTEFATGHGSHEMAPFPAWMGGFLYTSSSSSNQGSNIIIDTLKLKARRRSAKSTFGYFQEVKVKETYPFDNYHKRTTRYSNHPHNHPSENLQPTTLIAELGKFFQREWKCINRGRWGQSSIMEVGLPLLIFGSVIVLSLFLDHRYRSKIERERAAEKEREDWGDEFQGDSNWIWNSEYMFLV